MLRIAASVCGLVAVLAGCGPAAVSSSGSSTGPLSVWVRASAASAAEYQTLMNAFTKQTGIKVSLFASETDFETKLNAAATAHNLPDVVVDDAAELGNFRSTGIIQPVDRGSIAGQDELTARAWQSAQDLSGQYYAIPFSAQADLLFVRSDWMKKVNMPAPANWNQMVQLARAFTTRDPNGNGKNDTYGVAIPGATKRGYISWNWSTYLWQAGGDYFTKVGSNTFTSAIDSPQAVQAAQWFENLFCTQKVVQPGALNDDTSESNTAWQTDLAGMYLTGPYAFATSDATPVKGKYTVVAPPRGPANASVLAEGTSIYLMAGSSRTAEAKKLAEFLISPKGQTLGAGGVSVVRLPVNKTVSPSAAHGNDPRWNLAEQVYTAQGHYEPDYMPDWEAFRQDASNALNALVATCGSAQTAMQKLDATFTSLLKQQGVLAK
jgi:multiple sugar transport system substrate-binding protein